MLPLSPHCRPPAFSSQADYFSCVATLLHVRKDSCLYQACPSSDCNKKVIDQHNGRFRCEKCNRDFPNFEYRLLLSVSPQHRACVAAITRARTWPSLSVCIRPTWLTLGITSGWPASRTQLRSCWVTVRKHWDGSETRWDKAHTFWLVFFIITCQDSDLHNTFTLVLGYLPLLDYFL